MGPPLTQTLAPLLLDEEVTITFLRKQQAPGTGSFVFSLTITVELVLVLNLGLKHIGPEASLVAMVAMTPSCCHVAFL